MADSSILPNFQDIDLSTVESQLKALLAASEQEVERVLQQPGPKTWSNFMQPIDDANDEVNRFWSIISHLHSVKDSPEMRAVYDACLPHLTAHGTRMGHHTGLYQAIEALQQSPQAADWCQAQKMVIDHELRDFKLAGVALPAEQKKEMETLRQALVQSCTQFSNHVLDATQSWTCHITDQEQLAGLPEHVCVAAKQKAEAAGKDGWVFGLDFPVYFAVLSYAKDRGLRENMYRAYVTRASDAGPEAGQRDNGPVIESILEKRHALAKLLGFPNFAEYALATKMAASPEQVIAFLEKLATPSLPKAKEELAVLREYAADELGLTDLQPWDMTFAAESLRQKKYHVSQEELRSYFQLPNVLQTLSWLLQTLFGLSIESVNDADTWHNDVMCFRLVDSEKNVRSYYYMDLYARADKRGGAWMSDLQGRRLLNDGNIQLPVALINCNFTPPSTGGTALLTHDEVETLFHEFGHALQHMLTTIDYAGVAGINGVPWDAVEFPSQFFENWIWEPVVLEKMTCHVESGKPLPKEMQEKMIAARHFQAAMRMLRQIEFSLFDMRLHTEYTGDEKNQATRILNEVREKISVTPVAEPNRFQNSFTHVFDGGYAAGYYSYKWAEVMAIDAFMLFREQGLFDKELAQRFLHCVLEPGGSEDPAVLFRRLANRDPDPESLLKHDHILES